MSSRDPEREASWERRWTEEPRLRHTFLMLSLGWGIGLFAEAAVRVPLVYLLPIDVMAGLSQLMLLAAIGVLVAWTVAYIRRARRRGAAAAAEQA